MCKLITLIFLMFCNQVLGAAAAGQSKVEEDASSEFNSGLKLSSPYIRVSVEDYAKKHSGNRKLLLGEGHINSSTDLPDEFKKGGSQELTQSLLDEKTDFHKNEGFYTASAEGHPGFGSDWVGDFNNPFHRKSLFIPNTFDLIFDATYIPAAFSEDLFSSIASSLRPKGKFVMQLVVDKDNDLYVTGHDIAKHAMPWFTRKLKFKTFEAVKDYWSSFLKSKGFSKVEFHESPMVKTLREVFYEGKAVPAEDDHKYLSQSNWDQERVKKLIKAADSEDTDDLLETAAAKLDQHLAHYGLSTHYIIATKD